MSKPAPVKSTPAEELLGLELKNGWRVIEKIPKSDGATGGNFSTGYIVENKQDGRAFLKALDYTSALASPDPARALQSLVEAYNFERDLLNRCRDRRLKRVVMPLDDGSVQVNDFETQSVVQYIIFELADGDLRSHIKFSQQLDLSWTLRSLHHVATGMNELHGQSIAHRDLKPSNVMVFRNRESKVGDLGRSAQRGKTGPYDQFSIAGDKTYAPPELLYDEIATDWSTRHFGCDAYLMGSMIVFFFTGVSTTAAIMSELVDQTFHPRHWKGSFEDVLPYLRDAFGRAVTSVTSSVHPSVRSEINLMVRQLCDPEPGLRGHPTNRRERGNSFSLERYITKLDLLSNRVSYHAIRISVNK